MASLSKQQIGKNARHRGSFEVIDNALEGKISVNRQTGTSYTLLITDRGGVVSMTNASANTVTIPSGVFEVDDSLDIIQMGAGLTSVVGETGVDINGTTEAGGNESLVNSQGQYKVITLWQESEDSWVAIGQA
jgi:hypothetical protein